MIASYSVPLYDDAGHFIGVISTDIALPKLAEAVGKPEHPNDAYFMMTGKNGNPKNDKCYSETLQSIMPNVPQLHYKHIFGENFTSSALGVYAASHCLSQGCVPHFLYEDPCQSSPNEKINNIILFNQMNGQEYTFVLLKAI